MVLVFVPALEKHRKSTLKLFIFTVPINRVLGYNFLNKNHLVFTKIYWFTLSLLAVLSFVVCQWTCWILVFGVYCRGACERRQLSRSDRGGEARPRHQQLPHSGQDGVRSCAARGDVQVPLSSLFPFFCFSIWIWEQQQSWGVVAQGLTAELSSIPLMSVSSPTSSVIIRLI